MWRTLVPALVLVLAGCGSRDEPGRDRSILDEQVSLDRTTLWDEATRQIEIAPGTTVLAIAREAGSDIQLQLDDGESRVEVDTMLQGEGLEIALLESRTARHVAIRMRSSQAAKTPGTVHLRVEIYPAGSMSRGEASRLEALAAWTRATRASLTRDLVEKEALPDVDRAIAILESGPTPDPALAAMARLVRARLVYMHEIDWREAAREAERAAAAFAAAPVADPLDAARARRLKAAALQEIAADSRSVSPTAAEAAAEARALYAALLAPDSPLDPVGRGRVHNFLGLMDLDVQAWRAASAHFEAALREYDSARFRAGTLQTLRNMAFLADARGDFATAARAYTQALAEMDSIADWDGRAALLHNAAVNDINAGNTDSAIARLLDVIRMADEQRLLPARARALHGLGFAYWARGEYSQAQAFFTEALEIQRGLDDAATLFEGLRMMGAFMRETGDAAQALALHREALGFATTPMRTIRANIELARDHAAMGQFAAAVRACEAAAVVPLEDAAHPARREARLLHAELLVENDRARPAALREAEQIARSSLGHAGSAADLQAEVTAHRILARISRARGQRDQAHRHLEEALDIVSHYRVASTHPELRASARAGHQAVYGEYVDLLMSAPADPARQLRALQAVEQLRSLNYDAARGTPRDDGTDAPISRLLNELAARSIRLASLKERSRPSQAAIRSMELEMARLRAEIDRARLATQAQPATAAGGSWRPVAANGAQLSFFVGHTHAYLWRRDARNLRAWVLPGSADALREQIAAIDRIDPLQAPEEYDRAVLRLTRLLLPPGVVAAQVTDIQIVADAELSLLPFPALASPTDGARRFGETHVISRIPTLHVARRNPAPPAPRRWQLLAVDGGQVAREGLAELPGASGEVERIARTLRAGEPARTKFFRGTSATVAAIREAFEAGADVVHVAAHGLTDMRHPLASLIWLPGADGAQPSAYLSSGEIQRWQASVGLVFLSACETAVGPTRFGGEVAGLQSAFMRAGAEHVIATLWPVEDAAASEFSAQFYRHLSAGHSPSMALATTQREWSKHVGQISGWGYVLYVR